MRGWEHESPRMRVQLPQALPAHKTCKYHPVGGCRALHLAAISIFGESPRQHKPPIAWTQGRIGFDQFKLALFGHDTADLEEIFTWMYAVRPQVFGLGGG